MEKIKEQVSSLIVFNKTTLDELGVQYGEISDRITEGIEKMKEVGVFSDKEIKEINDFGRSILHNRYQEAKRDITTVLRESFEF